MNYRDEVQREVTSRGISQLFHFTPSRNASSILKDGLLSRRILEARGIQYLATDSMRLDDHLDAVSVSVHSINERMFAAKRREHAIEWLIFVFEASILWTHACRFCWVNAARNEIRNHRGFIGGPWAFQKMFEDQPGAAADSKSERETRGRSESEPTDNAAEVQILEPVDPDLIVGVLAPTIDLKRQLENFMPTINRVRPVKVREELFR